MTCEPLGMLLSEWVGQSLYFLSDLLHATGQIKIIRGNYKYLMIKIEGFFQVLYLELSDTNCTPGAINCFYRARTIYLLALHLSIYTYIYIHNTFIHKCIYIYAYIHIYTLMTLVDIFVLHYWLSQCCQSLKIILSITDSCYLYLLEISP